MNDVRNGIINNFEYNDQLLKVYRSHSKNLWCWQNSAISQKNRFLVNLDAPSEKTVYLQELVMIVKVILNNIVNIIYFDLSTVQSNMKELCKI